MQLLIDAIIENKELSSEEKFIKIKNLLSSESGITISDLDDTITANDCLFFTRQKWCKGAQRKEKIIKLLNNFHFHPNFLKVFHKIGNKKLFIISRNSHDFVTLFSQQWKSEFKKNNIEIIGALGRTSEFSFKSAQKICMIPEEMPFLTDTFEFRKIPRLSDIYSVDPLIRIYTLKVYCKKIFYAFGYKLHIL
jgi:predicted HNH restriction endonuclease